MSRYVIDAEYGPPPTPLEPPPVPIAEPLPVEAPPSFGTTPSAKHTRTPEALVLAAMPATGILPAYLDWAHRTTHAPPVFHLATMAPMAAWEIVRRGWHLADSPLWLWSAIVAGAATGKSSVIMRARRFVADVSLEVRRDGYEDPFLSLEGSLPGVLEALTKKTDTILGITPAILTHTEVSGVFKTNEVLETLCVLYDGDAIERNFRYLQKRADKGIEVEAVVRDPACCAVVASTPSSLATAVRPAHLEGGLGSRFCWWTGSTAGHELMPAPLEAPEHEKVARDAWWAFSGWLAEADAEARARAQHAANAAGGSLVAREAALAAERTVHLEPAAEAVLSAFFDEGREAIASGDAWGSVVMRSTNIARRVTGIYALMNQRTTALEVDAKCAVNFARLSLGCAKDIMHVFAGPAIHDKIDRLRSAILAAGIAGLTKRQLYATVRLTSGEMSECIATLVDAGDIVVAQADGAVRYFTPAAMASRSHH